MNKDSRALQILIMIVAFTLILFGLIYSAFAYQIIPGNSIDIFCENCTAYGQTVQNHLNQTISVECLQGSCNQTNTTNATCTIQKDLLRGEAIANKDGSCNINVTCDKENYGAFQDVKYPGVLYLKKDNKSVLLNIIIKNFKDEEFWRWGPKIITPEEIISAEYPIDFTCPHEVITEVNMQTCAEYLDPILGEQNPMIYALATGQNDCTNKLSNCTAETISSQKDLKECEIDLLAITDANNECHGIISEMQDDHRDEMDELELDYRDYRLSTVPIGWFWVSIILIVFWVIYIGYYLTSGGGF